MFFGVFWRFELLSRNSQISIKKALFSSEKPKSAIYKLHHSAFTAQPFSAPPLYLAAKYPKLIDSVDKYNNNGLHLAILQGHLNTVVFLIEDLDMDPEIRGKLERNGFVQACSAGKFQIVNYLADNYRKLIDSFDKYNDTGLHLAAKHGSMKIVLFLIKEQGSDPTVEGKLKRNAFLQACSGGNIEIVKYLAKRYRKLIDSVDEYNDNGLHLASLQCQMDTVVFLIETLKMDPAAKGYKGRNSYMKACEGGNTEIVKYLATKYPTITESVDKNKDNGLHMAAMAGKMDTVVFLIEKLNMYPAAKGHWGRNSFIRACEGGNTEIVKYLAENYPTMIESVDGCRNNGLHLATTAGKMDTVLFLIEILNMDPSVKDHYRRNSFLKACEFGYTEIVMYLAKKYPTMINSVDKKNNNGLRLAAEAGTVASILY